MFVMSVLLRCVSIALCALTVQGDTTFVDNCGTLTTQTACYTQSKLCYWTTLGCVLSCSEDNSRPYCDYAKPSIINCSYLELSECVNKDYRSVCYVSVRTGKCTHGCSRFGE
eukprot:PhF_6_TR33387/c0_g1_i1/m.48770